MKTGHRGWLAAIAGALLAVANVANAQARVDLPSPWPFADTVQRIEHGLQGAGLTVFARIDHQANASRAGLSMPPALVLVYGNPRGGTPLMLQYPELALDLPLRLLIREDGQHRVWVSYHPAADWARQQGLSTPQVQALGKSETLLSRLLSHP